jgi:hypothetical protein
MADAPALGAGGATRGGSSPLPRTNYTLPLKESLMANYTAYFAHIDKTLAILYY